jgi:endonuclease III
MSTIADIDKIMSLLKNTLHENDFPLISRKNWDEIKKDPFTVLISCILSLRTKDEVTEHASFRLFKKYPNPCDMVKASEEEIQQLIYPVGFYKVKAKRIKDISKTLIDQYDGKVPYDFHALLSLKGVGRKTANIVMVYGFYDTNYLPIDTHCHRIPNRLGWIKTDNPTETEKELKKILPKKYWFDFNHLFVLFGQQICTPISPRCSICPIEKYCKKRNVTTHR